MGQLDIAAADEQLIAEARHVLARYYKPGRHHVGAAVRTESGEIYSAVHLETSVGRAAVCAEAVALGKAISEGADEFDTIVAVMRSDEDAADESMFVVSPCGICRELISDYGPGTKVIYVEGGRTRKAPVLDLLPGKSTRAPAHDGPRQARPP